MIDWSSLITASSGDIRRLSSVWRYSSIPISVPENVAEHSYWVAMYSAMIHKHIGDNATLLGEIVLKGLTHDLAECVTGDIVRVFKYSSPELKKEINKAEMKLSSSLPEIITTIIPSGVGKYVESVVKAADFLSLYQYMRREASRSNLEIIPFYERMTRDLCMMSMPCDTSCSLELKPFYKSLVIEARSIADDCFRGLEENEKWIRKI